jgi:AraC family transcriptional regulator
MKEILLEPLIKMLQEKRLVGKSIRMSLSSNKIPELWRSFMPQRKQILNPVSPDLFSVEIYSKDYFEKFNPNKEFEKWAALEVKDFQSVPEGMHKLTIPGGLYAVFLHKGPDSAVTGLYQFILGTWISKSAYLLDDRPHFAVMGAKYKVEDPDSEEEIWIPIKPKSKA